MRFNVIVFFICLPSFCFSQYYLELKKLGNKRFIEFYSGEEIRFRLKSDENFSRAYITGVYENYLNFNTIKVSIEDIHEIDIRRKSSNRFRTMGRYISILSVGYFAIDMFNIAVINGNSFKEVFDKNIGKLCLIGIGVGFSFQFVKKKYFRNKGLNRIRAKKYF